MVRVKILNHYLFFVDACDLWDNYDGQIAGRHCVDNEWTVSPFVINDRYMWNN